MTVVVAAWNRDRQIADCLDSLAVQTPPPSIIVVDDGSTDRTAAVVGDWIAGHPAIDVRLLESDHAGPSVARNRGVAAATTEWIAFTDSDCVARPGWIAALVAAMAGDAVGGSGLVVQPPPRTWAELAYAGSNRIERSGAANRPLQLCNLILRRDLAVSFPFDPAIGFYGEEDDLGWRLLAAGHRLTFVADALVEHRHEHTLGSYLRQAWRGGRGATRLNIKHRRGWGRDVRFTLLAVLALPLGIVSGWLLAIPATFAALQVAALLYNETRLKHKPPATAVAVLPVAAAYNLVKAASVVWHRVTMPQAQRAALRDAAM